MPRFAAIIPNYNTGASIGASLSSLLAQTRPFDEILIIDDGSTDGSVAVIERLIAGTPHIRLIRNPENTGVVATLNRGMALIDADYVHMASANDTYSPDLTRHCEEALAARPDLNLFCGNALFIYEASGKRRPVFMHLPQTPHYIPAEAFHAIVRRNPLTFFGGGIILRRSAVMELGGMDETLRWHADWALYYLLAFRHGLYFSPYEMVNIGVSDTSYSSQALDWKKQREVIRNLIVHLGKSDAVTQEYWKSTALLPTYDIRACGLLRLPECRWYATPLLYWRLLIHTIAYRLKYIFPRSLLVRLRPFFRV